MVVLLALAVGLPIALLYQYQIGKRYLLRERLSPEWQPDERLYLQMQSLSRIKYL
jgi:hypothetical protein